MEVKKIISRGEAKALGLKRFFTGKPCRGAGHVADRYVSTGACVECESTRREKYAGYQVEYRKANAEKARLYMAEYYKSNKRLLNEANNNRRAKNRDSYRLNDALYYQKNKDVLYKKNRQRALRNATETSAYMAAYRKENAERISGFQREYRSKFPERRLAMHSKRRAAKLFAVPAFYGELDEFAFQEAARLSALRTKLFGFEWHSDHMIPLQAKEATGLHCAYNIAVIPAVLNIGKRNKMLYTTPGSWIADA